METIPIRRPPAAPESIPLARPAAAAPAARTEPAPEPLKTDEKPAALPLRPQPTQAEPVALPLKAHPAPPEPVEPPAARAPSPQRFAPEPPAEPQQPRTITTPTPDLDLPPLDLPPIDDADDTEDFRPAGARLDLTGAPVAPVGAAPPKAGPLPAFARPPAPGKSVSVPRAGGRTWYCRWCGMESEASDRCTWCKRDLRNLPASGSGKGPVLAGGKATSARPAARTTTPPRTPPPAPGAKAPERAVPTPAPAAKPVVAPPPPAAPPKAPARAAAVPELGAVRAQKSKYYADQVVDPVSGAHYDADTGQTTDTPVEPLEDVNVDDRVEQLRQTGFYLAALVGTIVLAALASRIIPDWYLAFLAATNLAAGMAMPLFRVVPFGEDDSSDVPYALAFILLLGPIVGGMAYGVIGMMRQDANPAIVGIFVSYLLIRFPLQMAAGADLAESLKALVPFAPPADGDWATHLALNWLPFVTLIGWYGAGMFHKPDE